MNRSFNLIAFEEAGSPRQKYSVGEMQDAARNGEITPDTRLEVHWSDGEREVMQARAFEPLADVFSPKKAEPKQLAETSPAQPEPALGKPQPKSPEPTVTVPPSAVKAPSASTVRPVTEQIVLPDAKPAAPRPAAPRAAAPVKRAQDRDTPPWGWILSIAMLLAIVIWYRSSDGTEPPQDTAVAEEAVEAPPVDPLANVLEESFFISRETNIRASPSVDGRELGKFVRNDRVTGKIVPSSGNADDRWLKITQGLHRDRYIWGVNLVPQAMPVLDSSEAGKWIAVSPADVRVGPSSAAAALPLLKGGGSETLTVGKTYTIAGVVDGNWAELGWGRRGVGYVPIDALVPEGTDLSPWGLAPATAEEPEIAGSANNEDVRTIRLTNQCSSTLRVALVYDSPRGSLWAKEIVGGNQSQYVTQSGTPTGRAQVTSTNIWYAIFDSDGTIRNMANKTDQNSQSFTIDGRSVIMRRASVKGGDQVIDIDFTC